MRGCGRGYPRRSRMTTDQTTYQSVSLGHSFSVFSPYLRWFIPSLFLLVTKVVSGRLSNNTDGDLMKVVLCMEHAVAAVRPRSRYSAGWDAKFFWMPLSYMPTCVQDYVLRRGSIPVAKQAPSSLWFPPSDIPPSGQTRGFSLRVHLWLLTSPGRAPGSTLQAPELNYACLSCWPRR